MDIITHGQQLVRDYALVDEKAASQQASDQYAQFGRGDAAMMMQGTWAISDIRIAQKAAGNTDEFGFTYYPWSDEEGKEEKKEESKEEVTLTFLHHMGEQGKKDGFTPAFSSMFLL